MTEKRTVESVNIFPVTLMALMNTRLELTCCSMVGSFSERADVSGVNVGRTGFWDRRWPLVVERESGVCLRTSSDVRLGQVAKYPASIAFVDVLTTGIKYAWCRYWTRLRLVVME